MEFCNIFPSGTIFSVFGEEYFFYVAKVCVKDRGNIHFKMQFGKYML